MSEHYTGCRVIWTTANHILLLCNQTTSTSTPLTTSETIQGSTTSILATTAAPTTGVSTTYYPTTPTPNQKYTPTPSQYLRGYTASPNSSYTLKSNGSAETNKTSPLTSTTNYPEYIYSINKTTTYVQNIVPLQSPNLIGIWVFISIIAILLLCMVLQSVVKNQQEERKRRMSVNPKNRNSWVETAKAQDVLLQMKQNKPPRPPNVKDAKKRLAEITRRSLDAYAKSEGKRSMTIKELTTKKGLEKLKSMHREKNGPKSYVRNLQTINKIKSTLNEQ